MKFIILSSSRGTTMQAVLEAVENGLLTMECLGLISDKSDRGCVEKAKAAGLPVTITQQRKDMDREGRDKALDAAIEAMGGSPEDTIIAALGWMFILSPWFVQKWEKRIINVHPSLLPKFPGAHAIADALAAGETESGMTIHFIDEGVDTGEIIVQKSCSINDGDTEDSLKENIQALEKEWFPKVLQEIEEGEITLT